MTGDYTAVRRPAPVEHPIHELLSARWSPRAIDAGRPVEPEKLATLFEAARWAPSCFNDQPWNYLVCTADDPAALERARTCLSEGNAWALAAPVLLFSIARTAFLYNGKPNRFAQHDQGMASLSMALEAVNQGLVFHQMAGFSRARFAECFPLPEGYEVLAAIAVGYPGRIADLPPDKQAAESAPRERRPWRSFIRFQRW